jgi:glycosyltransferase involved in cell wall biosynthesis
MRILITGTTGDSMPPPYGGIPKVSLLYAREWKKGGHEVAVTFVYRPNNADDLGANVEYFFEYGSKPNKLKKFLFLIKYFCKNIFLYIYLFREYLSIYPKFQLETFLYSAYGVYMSKVIETYKPDIILSEAALIKTFMVLRVASRKDIPVVIDSYAEIHDQGMGVNKYLDDFGQKKYWVNFLEKADLVLGIDNCTKGARKYVPNDKVREFYDTCDFTLARAGVQETKEELRKYFKQSKTAFIIGAVGAFEFRKGHDHLIRAVSILVRKGYDVGASICGGSGDRSKWEELARKEGVINEISFMSRLSESDLMKFHKSNDAYCNLSNSPRSCGLDLALLEAMACEMPIVVYNNGALSNAVVNENGYVVYMGDIEGVSGAILKLMEKSKSDQKEMGLRSRIIAEKYDINNTSEIKLGWLKEVLDTHKK